jgi:hypothetical protein
VVGALDFQILLFHLGLNTPIDWRVPNRLSSSRSSEHVLVFDWPVLLARTRSFGAVRPERERKLPVGQNLNPIAALVAGDNLEPVTKVEAIAPIERYAKAERLLQPQTCWHDQSSTYKVCLASTPVNFYSMQPYCNYHSNHSHDTPFI